MTDPADLLALESGVLSGIAARASDLFERSVDAPAVASANPSAAADAATVLRFWSQTFAPGDDAAFDRRLAWDGLDRQTALSLAAGGRVQADPPEWTRWLKRFAAAAAGVADDLRAEALAEADPAAWTDEPPFIELWMAPMRAARRELHARVPAAARALVDQRAFRSLEQQLAREASIWGERAVFDAFRAATDTIPPDRSAGTNVYRAFVLELLERGLVPLWDRWPVLARQLAFIAECWVASTAELLERISEDRGAIAATFGDGRDPGVVIHIDPALSDPHRGRRRVTGVRFESGLRVVYKPRDLTLDRAFGDLLAWLAGRGLDPAPRPLRVLARGGYGWVEYAEHEPMPSRDHARGAFRTGGSLLCLAHVLRARDLHMENVIVGARGPVVVDLEPLFQPVEPRARGQRSDTSEAGDWDDGNSCLETGLLHLYEIAADGAVFDVGGLGGDGQGVRVLPKRIWKRLRSADITFEDETRYAATGRNQVVLDGARQQAEHYDRQILAGFTDTYRLLIAERDRLLAEGGPLAAFDACRTRVIQRPTDQYAMLSAVLAGPRYQSDGAMRSAAFDILLRPFRAHVDRPGLWPVLVEERRALQHLDIPHFEARAAGTAVEAAGRTLVPEYFAASGSSAVRARVKHLSEADLADQCGRIARALAESPRSRFESTIIATSASSGPCVDYASWIGRELQRRAEPAAGGLTWWPASGGPSRHTCPHALYDGATGVALFFAALHVVTCDAQWADTARAAIAPVLRSVENGEFSSWPGDRIGAADGLGSVVYALAHLDRLLGDGAFGDAALRVAGALADRIDRCSADDVMGGAAGGVLGLLALQAVRPNDRLLEWAASCGRKLIDRQVPVSDGCAWPAAGDTRLVGFAHGAAGIAHALERLWRATGDEAAAVAAAQGRRFVCAQFLAADGNWPIAAGAAGAMTAWCHGAPGIVLALSEAESVPRTALDAGLATSSAWQPGGADHLCCGALGRAEVLLTVGHQLGDGTAVEAGRALATKAVTRARAASHFRLSTSGPEYRVFDPGFFRGISGIGYALLRQAEPSLLPAVLTLDPPKPADSAGLRN